MSKKTSAVFFPLGKWSQSKLLEDCQRTREEVEGQVLELYHHKTKPKFLKTNPRVIPS
jgi:hypothetical protein